MAPKVHSNLPIEGAVKQKNVNKKDPKICESLLIDGPHTYYKHYTILVFFPLLYDESKKKEKFG